MFRKHRSKSSKSTTNSDDNQMERAPTAAAPPVSPVSKNSLQFYCQLAHGSPTTFVSNFKNIKELYERIGESFNIPASEILYCTLNSYKIDMNKLLGGQIGLEDFIFAHCKGRPKEVELTKSDNALGLTITDNGAGYAFIKRIKEDSIIHHIQHIRVGDHIEKLNGVSMVGKRHFEVANALKNIPLDSTFTIRVVEPLKSGFSELTPKSSKGSASKKGYGSGKETLRFKADGNAVVQEQDDAVVVGIEKINEILESFMGINDSELALQIWDLSVDKKNSMDFAEAVDDSELAEFAFTDELLIEIWGVITDVRDKRL